MRLLIDAPRIAERVEAMAADIAAVCPRDTVMVAVMKGSLVFAADLLRALGRAGMAPRFETLRLRSYGSGTVSSGAVELVGPLPAEVVGRPVLLVDDIADSGRSLDYARRSLLAAGATEVRICALLDKPSRRVVPVPVEFVGFSVDDLFVVGYGIDYAEDYRYLPYIGVVD